MKIILHIGMPKTGSTALQSGFSSLRRSLFDSGVLYPESPGMKDKQALLIYGLSPKRLPRYLRYKYNEDVEKIGRAYASWFDRVRRTIDRDRPDVLLLSDEELFKVNHDAGLIALGESLRSLADVVEVVAYVRKPSDRYLSAVQQVLKASHHVRTLEPVVYRTTLERYAMHVADKMHVVKYDRTAWPNGDILRHFLDTFVPSANVDLSDTSRVVNSSLGADAMALLASYRKQHWPDQNNQFTPDTRRLVRAISAAEKELGGAQPPRLHERVQQALDYSSPDLLWLRDEHGIIFDGINYSKINSSPTDLAELPQPKVVEDICPVDSTRKFRLAIQTMRHLAEPPER